MGQAISYTFGNWDALVRYTEGDGSVSGWADEGLAVLRQPRSSEVLVNVDEVQTFAKEFRESHKGRWVPVDRLGGFCLLLERVVLTKIGIELEPWTDLSLFDTDILSSKARQAGFTLACCRDCFVHHFGTRTFARGPAVNKLEPQIQ